MFHLLEKTETPSVFSRVGWYRKVAAHRFDLLVDFQQLPRCRMLTRFSHAPARLSFPAPWHRPFLYTHTVKPTSGYAAATKASLLAPLGIVWQGERPHVYLMAEEIQAARSLLEALGYRAGQRLVTVDPTHRRESKRWPLPSYARLIDLLSETESDLRFLLLRGPGEEAEMRILCAACAHPENIFLPETPPDLRISAACISLASLHIGNCSAPRHIAVATDTPSLVIPGASGPEWRYPDPRHRELRPQLPCQPCHKARCPDPVCLTRVTPEQALTQALDLLASCQKAP
jgi:ADP-heptose:LPS heptosyltransferase